jgi:hypothetical protein
MSAKNRSIKSRDIPCSLRTSVTLNERVAIFRGGFQKLADLATCERFDEVAEHFEAYFKENMDDVFSFPIYMATLDYFSLLIAKINEQT